MDYNLITKPNQIKPIQTKSNQSIPYQTNLNQIKCDMSIFRHETKQVEGGYSQRIQDFKKEFML